MVKRILYVAALALFPVTAFAQVSAVHPVYVRAQTLVNDGDAAGGRALVDSMLAIAAQGSNEYAEAVYWRAVLASTAADAEMDYRRVVVDYPLSPRVEDALIRLAQLEIARANYDGALRHLNRLVAEHPQSPARPRAGYWMARALFDKNDMQGGCAATADALSRTSESDAELRNQITYLNQRCAGIVVAAPAQVATPQATADSGQVVAAVVPPSAPPVIRDTAARVPAAPPPAPRAEPVRSAPQSAPEISRAWSVQVAAYNLRSQADAMVARLKTNGYEARVDGETAPFRVKIGRYTSQGQASAVQRSLKAKKIEGFVVQADTR